MTRSKGPAALTARDRQPSPSTQRTSLATFRCRETAKSSGNVEKHLVGLGKRRPRLGRGWRVEAGVEQIDPVGGRGIPDACLPEHGREDVDGARVALEVGAIHNAKLVMNDKLLAASTRAAATALEG